jgi:hypothetical protein
MKSSDYFASNLNDRLLIPGFLNWWWSSIWVFSWKHFDILISYFVSRSHSTQHTKISSISGNFHKSARVTLGSLQLNIFLKFYFTFILSRDLLANCSFLWWFLKIFRCGSTASLDLKIILILLYISSYVSIIAIMPNFYLIIDPYRSTIWPVMFNLIHNFVYTIYVPNFKSIR